jgi:unsaturated rhamnogalacturonyl hydrolase
MALVDVLDYFPKSHPQRASLVKYLQRLAPVLARYQDPATGGWWQVMDQGSRAGNYVETSASCMFVYALQKGVRLGYLNNSYGKVARQGYEGILKKFVQTEPDGSLALNGTVSVGGLGGTPYRDGSYEYYLSEPLKQNDFKGVGPFIMASVEMEMTGRPVTLK